MFDVGKSGQGDISISPQPFSAVRIQDSDHTFSEEVLSVHLPKIHLNHSNGVSSPLY